MVWLVVVEPAVCLERHGAINTTVVGDGQVQAAVLQHVNQLSQHSSNTMIGTQ